VESIRAIPRDKIFIVQLADAPTIDMDYLYWSRHFRCMPSQGDLPVKDFMSAVAATGYDGYLSLEIFNDQFRGGSPRSIASDGRRSLVYLIDQVAREQPEIAIKAPAMPDRIGVSGIEFVEFAADEAEAAELAALFRTLGFSLAGRHISKDVTLFRQGQINLVINTEREGFAHSSYLVHGTSVCAIGLKVEDAGATVARAAALGAEPFAQPVGPGELKIPAIRGVGGGVIHFIDQASPLARVWDVEFVAAQDPDPPCDAGLVRVDHLGQTMEHKEMLTWLLFYTSIFRTHKTPMVDVIDPAGVVRSQAIETEDGAMRLTLNGAENHRTLAGHFIAESFGASVQHLAFASQDIFATAAALKANGFRALPMSRNYYDDIEARFGLEAEFADRLRTESILYDRDQQGEYFQLYCPTYGDGFIFEIVERRGPYRGYGAPNAAFRIAAQKRLLMSRDELAL
jgi:4-hydroxyphenylpyruvate dioxygenase